jgi:nucleoside 2-deoxyribosyltransferase
MKPPLSSTPQIHPGDAGPAAVTMPSVTFPRLYLAGPDVFRPDAAAHGRLLLDLCTEHGFAGVFPLSDTLPDGPATLHDTARHIYQANLRHIDGCDAMLANLDFFRGPEPDSGTCFEVGYAVARGKPVIGYVPESGSYAERIRLRHPAACGAGAVDVRGWQLEEFGLPLNLMLGVPCRIVVGDARAALAALRAQWANGPAGA